MSWKCLEYLFSKRDNVVRYICGHEASGDTVIISSVLKQKTEQKPMCRRRLSAILFTVIAIAFLEVFPSSTLSQVTGTLDLIQNQTIALGWAYDPAKTSESIEVQFYVDGPFTSGTFAGVARTDVLRQDVNQTLNITGNHGFHWFIPWEFRDGKTHSLYVYGVSATMPNQRYALNLMAKVFLAAPAPQVSSQRQTYNIGAWYFTAWSSANDFQAINSESVYGRHDAWGGIRDHALGADPWKLNMDYSDRKPLLGFYDQLEQEIMDSHIRQAISRGLSFFAFYWYWNSDTNTESKISKPMMTFLSSALKKIFAF